MCLGPQSPYSQFSAQYKQLFESHTAPTWTDFNFTTVLLALGTFIIHVILVRASPVIDKPTQLKTIFTYSPASPVIDKPTQLRFDVVQLQNGTKLGNLSARVIVLSNASGQERSFIFPKVVSNNGSFSVTYLFPDSGSYQVISRIDSKGFVTLSSFRVFVPMQAGDIVSFLAFTGLVVGIVTILSIVAIKYMPRRKRGE